MRCNKKNLYFFGGAQIELNFLLDFLIHSAIHCQKDSVLNFTQRKAFANLTFIIVYNDLFIV